MTTLQELVTSRRQELGLAYRQVEERSAVDGQPLVSRSTVNKIERGIHGDIEDRTLKGLALGLSLPVGQVREAAGRPREEPTEFRLPERANHLSDAERKAILRMVDTLLGLHQGGVAAD